MKYLGYGWWEGTLIFHLFVDFICDKMFYSRNYLEVLIHFITEKAIWAILRIPYDNLKLLCDSQFYVKPKIQSI